MTQLNPENFFDNTGGGSGAPSAKLKELDDFVFGEIVDQFMVEATEFATGEIKKDKKTGAVIYQLVVILQTDNRNWANVAKVPLKDKDDKSSGPKDPSEDDGKRAVYIEPWTNIHAAVGAAVVEATGEKGPIRNGGKLGVKIIELRDTGKGNPLKVHQAKYVAPVAQAASDTFFDQTSSQSAPANEAPAQSQAAPAEQKQPQPEDPWASSTPAAGSAPAKDKPPF
jgi:hypothetical protein